MNISTMLTINIKITITTAATGVIYFRKLISSLTLAPLAVDNCPICAPPHSAKLDPPPLPPQLPPPLKPIAHHTANLHQSDQFITYCHYQQSQSSQVDKPQPTTSPWQPQYQKQNWHPTWIVFSSTMFTAHVVHWTQISFSYNFVSFSSFSQPLMQTMLSKCTPVSAKELTLVPDPTAALRPILSTPIETALNFATSLLHPLVRLAYASVNLLSKHHS